VAEITDGMIVGGRIIQLMETDGLAAVGNFVTKLRHTLDKVD
jgi:tryptophan synthase alpha subunit